VKVFAPDPRAEIRQHITDLKAVLDSLPIDDVLGIIDALHHAYEQGGHVFIIGNGGSAATASHMACDLAKTALGRPIHPGAKRFKVISLTDNVPLLTAWGNDAGYELIFAEQLRNVANPGDLLIAITGSGNSLNIVEAVKAAKELGLRSIGLLGFDGGQVKDLVDQAVVIDSDNCGHIEDVHMVVNHLITVHFQRALSS
jgi:D-sedoheptulose 7-phosphate isomerase